jgi:hypothetical protein
VAPPVFKTGLAAIAVAGGFDSLPPPPHASTIRDRESIGAIGQLKLKVDQAHATDFRHADANEQLRGPAFLQTFV